MKLELKHIKGYLDAGLKGQANFLGEKNIYTISTDNVRSCFSPNNSIKPILYPLSYLTKEIEVNGEKFVPYKWLKKNYLAYDKYDGNWFKNKTNLVNIKILPYDIVEKLFEWHFDIHGLIEQGLAIDKSTM